jgi:hypothetical protein
VDLDNILERLRARGCPTDRLACMMIFLALEAAGVLECMVG